MLSTLICEVEKILNSTPLFHVPVDPDDEEPLTPFHFLIGRSSPSYPAGPPTDDSVDLRRRWKHAQLLSDHFWKRWIREYLPTLARRPKWNKNSKNVEIGDVVIVVDPQSPRGLWPRGIVKKRWCATRTAACALPWSGPSTGSYTARFGSWRCWTSFLWKNVEDDDGDGVRRMYVRCSCENGSCRV